MTEKFMNKIPVLGVEPSYIWKEKRIQALKDAVTRAKENGEEPNPIWIKELEDFGEKFETDLLSGHISIKPWSVQYDWRYGEETILNGQGKIIAMVCSSNDVYDASAMSALPELLSFAENFLECYGNKIIQAFHQGRVSWCIKELDYLAKQAETAILKIKDSAKKMLDKNI